MKDGWGTPFRRPRSMGRFELRALLLTVRSSPRPAGNYEPATLIDRVFRKRNQLTACTNRAERNKTNNKKERQCEGQALPFSIEALVDDIRMYTCMRSTIDSMAVPIICRLPGGAERECDKNTKTARSEEGRDHESSTGGLAMED